MTIRSLACALLFLGGLCPAFLEAAESYDRKTERVWKTSDGKETTARFSGMIRNEVLLNASGAVKRVPLNKLSPEDLDWVRELMKQEGTLSKLPKEYQTKPESAPESTGSPAEPSVDAAEVPDSKEMKEEPTAAEEPSPFQPAGETPADDNPFQPANDSLADEAMVDENPFAESKNENPDDTVRDWTDKNGQTVNGSLQSVEGEQAVILSGKRIIRVPLSGFSQKDLEWIVGDYRKRGKLTQLPEKYRSINRPFEKPKTAGLMDSRTWTDNKGGTMEARFMSVSGEEVTLLGTGFVRSPLSQLSREDLIWLQNAMRDEGRLTELELPFRDPPDPKLKGADLTKFRRTKYFRKWTLYTGISDTAQWQSLEKGEVNLLSYATKATMKIPYRDLSEADKEYVRGRLKTEMPGELFPAVPPEEITPEQAASGFRIWTDLDGQKVAGKLVRSDKGWTVNILETADGEKPYIAAFFSDADRAMIEELNKPKNAVAGVTTTTGGFTTSNYNNAGGTNNAGGSHGNMGNQNQGTDNTARQLAETNRLRREEEQRQRDQERANSQNQYDPTDPANLTMPNFPATPQVTVPMGPVFQEAWECVYCKKRWPTKDSVCDCMGRKIVGSLKFVVPLVIGVVVFIVRSSRS